MAGDSAYLPQKNLIDASIQAGVRRFAPSEWATYVHKASIDLSNKRSAGLENTPWYGFKENTRKYLAELNKNKKVSETPPRRLH